MTIDIDSFLDDFDVSESKKEDIKEKPKKEIDLTFKDYLSKKFSKLEDNVNEEDFEFLVKAYSEIKKFDENLPNKMFEVKKESGSTISNIGTKYTQTFLNGIRMNMQKHGNFVNKNLELVEKLLKENQIQKAVNLYNEVTKSYKLFPKEFIFEKIALGEKIRKLDIKINEKFKVYWASELKAIKMNLVKEISELKHNLVPGNITLIESKLHKINNIIDKAPKIFYNELLNERIQVSKIVIISEEFLRKQYEIEFIEKEELFNKLFERFHRYQLKKDMDSALVTYDEIILTFGKMPDAFIEKKIEIYNKINNIFDSLNNMLLTNNIDRFMNTYKQSKIINQAREYISHVQKSKQFDLGNLLTIRENLNNIPVKLKPEKVELEIQIDKIIEKQKALRVEKKLRLDKPKVDGKLEKQKLEELELKVKKIRDEKKVAELHIETVEAKEEKPLELQENSEEEIEIKTESLDFERGIVKEILRPKVYNPRSLLKNMVDGEKINHVNLAMIDEVVKNYDQIFQVNDDDQIDFFKQKIRFYINLLPLTEIQKVDFKKKLDI